MFYHLNLIPCHDWSWQSDIFFLVNIFVRHTFPMSNGSIKTKTVLTISHISFNNWYDRIYWALSFSKTKGWLKSMCICVVLSWYELKVRQNLLASDYEIHMVCLLVATVDWHKSLQFVKKSNIILSPCLFMILCAVSMITLCSTAF